jgi:hypothetical protein
MRDSRVDEGLMGNVDAAELPHLLLYGLLLAEELALGGMSPP